MPPRSDPLALVTRAIAGDRSAVAKLISMMELGGDDAAVAIGALYRHTGNAYTIGITGAPGAGKSTLTDKLLRRIRRDGDEVGVLAIDPTSPFSGGAILGDRIRMQDHAVDPGVFIRSMATRGHLGGLSLATRQGVRVLDAVGKPWIVIETVGVGQVEVEIVEAADTTVVVLNPGWGDGVQANKAGLLEIADVFVVNKADRDGTGETVRDLEAMLDLGGHPPWRPPIVETVGTTGKGVDELFEAIVAHRLYVESSGELARRRGLRLRDEIRTIVAHRLELQSRQRCSGADFEDIIARVERRELDPYGAADAVMGLTSA